MEKVNQITSSDQHPSNQMQGADGVDFTRVDAEWSDKGFPHVGSNSAAGYLIYSEQEK